MATDKKSFVVYHDVRKPLSLLSNEQIGLLFISILNYSEYGTIPEFENEAVQMAFCFIQNTLDRDAAAWEDRRKRRQEAGSKGGKARAENQANSSKSSNANQCLANQAVNVNGTVSDTVNGTVSDTVKSNKDKSARSTKFVPPTVEEVRLYCLERGNAVDPEQFVDFYTAKGWRVGSAVMKDWRAAVRTWEKREHGAASVKSKNIRDPDRYTYAEGESL